ncbi:concanavalin A-like lectin/glucanase domain-containing protein [Bisporella sp. PMI_857]|nr:concanavalin A-like lectin/glucanase domain-containing protein [Bisporella sp. PMI_857]
MNLLSLLIGATGLITPIVAQTFTLCNPMERDDCPNDPAFGLKDHTFTFNDSRTVTDSFNITNGALSYGSNGAEFTITKRKESPTIRSKFYIFFGSVSIIMRAALGQGIISSIVLQSEDLDEVDWEFMGGFPLVAQSNYFGKGNTTSYDRAVYHNASSDVHDNFHNYTVDWTQEKMDFYIDSVKVRTLMYGDANGGKNYPQTPCTVRLGVWAGGDEENTNGTIEWSGGLTDYSKAPFTMYVKSAQISDYSTGKEYEWTDRSGSFQSIKAIQGNSTVAETIAKTEEEIANPPLSLAQKFNNLSTGAKVAVYAGGGGAAALLLGALIFTCIRQRRKGRAERDAYNAKVEAEQERAYKDQMELREKGLGGWDNDAYAKQGDDALGGWGGTHVTPGQGDVPPMPKVPSNVMVSEVPSRMHSPAPTIPRMQSPGVVSPVPQSPRQWSGGNQGGMIHDAHNAYTGGYGSSNTMSRSQSYASQGGPQSYYTGGYGQSQGGYQRF